jgi:hypothetical protein
LGTEGVVSEAANSCCIVIPILQMDPVEKGAKKAYKISKNKRQKKQLLDNASDYGLLTCSQY